MSNYIPRRRNPSRELIGQMDFHKTAVTEVKKRMGSKCTFLSHLESGGTIKFLAKLKGIESDIEVNTGKSKASELAAEDYKQLKTVLDGYFESKKPL